MAVPLLFYRGFAVGQAVRLLGLFIERHILYYTCRLYYNVVGDHLTFLIRTLLYKHANDH